MRTWTLLAILSVMIVAVGCSAVNDPISSDTVSDGSDAISHNGSNHAIWGFWQGVIDPASQTIGFTPVRACDMHLNALHFLEPPLLVNLSLEYLEFDGNTVIADIGLKHPFLGLNEFTGFDVCGIFITKGSVSGFSDPDIVMAGEGDTRLLNPDGYARWWNPVEFPVNEGTMFSYQDGLLGTPHSKAGYDATVNGYKYFCDDLDVTGILEDVTLSNRGMFGAGMKNVRRYIIELGAGLIFNYAVDACWEYPTSPHPWSVPDDFGPLANRTEAWRISATDTENTLYNDGAGDLGGDLTLLIDVYDWFDADSNTIRVESPGNFPMIETASPIGSGDGYSTYEVEITDATPDEDQIELLISVISEDEDFGGFIVGTNTTAYFTTGVEVAGESQEPGLKNIPLRTGVAALDLGIQHDNGDCWILYNDDQVWMHRMDEDYQTGYYQYTVTCASPTHDFHPKLMDVNSLGVAAFGHNTPTLTVCWTWVYLPDGTRIVEKGLIGACIERWLPDVGTFGDSGTWADHIVHFCGGYWQNHSYRNWWYIYGPPNYNSWDPPDGGWSSEYTGTGITGVDHLNVTAIDTDKGGDYLWILEGNTENHCSMWQRTPPGGWPRLDYANSYFPTSGDSDHWYDPVDLTRDDTNRSLLLDEVGGHGIISVWTGSATGGSYIGYTGDSSSIGEKPRRIDGSDYDGKVFVIHGDSYGPGQGYYLSVFMKDELP